MHRYFVDCGKSIHERGQVGNIHGEKRLSSSHRIVKHRVYCDGVLGDESVLADSKSTINEWERVKDVENGVEGR